MVKSSADYQKASALPSQPAAVKADVPMRRSRMSADSTPRLVVLHLPDAYPEKVARLRNGATRRVRDR